MAVELDGNVRMRGDNGPGVAVTVLAEHRRIRVLSGDELVGDWNVGEIGIVALQEGFNVRVAGEEFVLRTTDDAAFAEEIGVSTASPRLARMIAARHNPEIRETPIEEEPEKKSNLVPLGYALAGALVVLGGVLLDRNLDPELSRSGVEANGFDYWLAFIVGGVVMIAVAYVMSLGYRVARYIALALLLTILVVFGFAASGTTAEGAELTSYGFVAGGLVVGVAVLFSRGVGADEDV